MKAAVLVKEGSAEQAFEIREVDKPTPSKDQVLIKVECFGLNYADVMARNGLYDPAPKIPSILGYEVVGKIVEVGEDVDKSRLDERVVAFTRFGGYAEYAVTAEQACVAIGTIDAAAAAAVAVQYATAYYMAYDAIQLHSGDKVMIHAGAGGVGTALIQLCKLKKCEIFSNAGSDEKLDYMRKQGADHVMNYRKNDYAKEIPKILKEEKLEVTFNPIAGSTFKKDLRLLAPGGKLMLFGGSERSGKKWGILSTLNFLRKMGLLIPISLLITSKAIIGVNMLTIADQNPQILKRCLEGVVKLLKDQKIKPHIGARFQATEISKAHAFLESRKSKGKVVVFW
ncbi:MAG: zinc-binding dehydrogenase [Crocinitomicaceae bacterium]